MTRDKKNISEVIGDYSMAGALRSNDPGNIRAGQQVVSTRRSVLSDEESESFEDVPKRVCVFIFRPSDGKILAVSRWDDETDMNLPGGHVEPGETLDAAAKRELWEETGIIAHRLVKVYTGRSDGGMTTAFRALDATGKVRSSEEGTAKWVEEAELYNGTFGDFYSKIKKSL
jgi:ADP-ribose pyrophosphatase YjhB (NUDIX family)